MIKITTLILTTGLLFAACSTPPGQVDLNQVITGENPALQELENTNEVQDSSGESGDDHPPYPSIADQFQTIYIDPDQVKIISSELVEWPDSCLGIERLDVDCVPEKTPGYAVILEAQGLQFAYHSDEIGSQVQPATPGLVWTRDDSSTTICDRLVIFLPDTAHVCWCVNGELHTADVNLQEILTEEEYHLLIDSLTTFSENTVNQPTTDQSNPLMVSLAFHGQGQTFPSADQQASLISMAELIFGRAAH